MEDWISLPQISRGRGAGRRFHPDAQEVLRRAKVLYGTGLGADQIVEILRAEALPRPDEAEPSSVSEIAGDILALASLSAESAAPSAVEPMPAPPVVPDMDSERLLREIGSLKQVIAKAAADQRRENARFRSVLGALVDLIEVQDQNRRLGMAEKEKRDTQAQQRLMAGVQELLRVHREEEAPEEPADGARPRGRMGRRRFR